MSLDRWWSWVLVAALLGCGSGAEQPPPVEPPPPQDPPHAPTDVGVQPEFELVPADGSTVASLGEGIDAISGSTRDRCARVESSRAPADERFVQFEHPLALDAAARLVGLPAGRHAVPRGLTVWPYLVESPLSRTYLYAAEAVLEREQVTAVTGWSWEPGTSQFRTSCGDEVVTEVARGGRLVLVFKVRFPDLAARRAFEAAVGERPAPWELVRGAARADAALEGRYSHEVSLNVWGPTSLGVGLTDEVTRCWGWLPGCGAFVDAVVDRALGLSEAARASPGELGYTLSPWAELSPSAPPPRELPAGLVLARESLTGRRTSQRVFADAVRAAEDWPSEWAGADDLDLLAARVEWNLTLLQSAIDGCFDPASLEPEDLAGCLAGATEAHLLEWGYDPTLTLDRVVF